MSTEKREITRPREETVILCDGCGGEIDPVGDRLMLVEFKYEASTWRRTFAEMWPTGRDFHSDLCLRAFLSSQEEA